MFVVVLLFEAIDTSVSKSERITGKGLCHVELEQSNRNEELNDQSFNNTLPCDALMQMIACVSCQRILKLRKKIFLASFYVGISI